MGDLAALDAHRATLTAPAGGWQDASFERALPGLPLFHRLGQPLRHLQRVLSGGELNLELALPRAGRAEIGVDQCVFASFGVAAYWQPPIVMAFGPVEDYRHARCSLPWDSRGSGAIAGWSLDRHQQLVQRYSLHAPDDEKYMALHLSTCFQTWDQFLSGARPVAPDSPDIGVLRAVMAAPPDRDLAWLTVPEARFALPQGIGDRLLAVFVDADFPDTSSSHQEWLETFTVLQRVVERRNRTGFKSLRRMKDGGTGYQQAAYAFTRGWLRSAGYLT